MELVDERPSEDCAGLLYESKSDIQDSQSLTGNTNSGANLGHSG